MSDLLRKPHSFREQKNLLGYSPALADEVHFDFRATVEKNPGLATDKKTLDPVMADDDYGLNITVRVDYKCLNPLKTDCKKRGTIANYTDLESMKQYNIACNASDNLQFSEGQALSTSLVPR